MTPAPKPVSLLVCEQVIEDRKSGNMTLVSLFDTRRVLRFPSARISFSVFCALTDAEGAGTMTMRILSATDHEPVFQRAYPIRFPSRLTIVRVHVRLNDVQFDSPGRYVVSLDVDREFIADAGFAVLSEAE